MKYTRENNQFHLFCDGEHIASYDTVSMMVDMQCKTLLKHGSEKNVLDYYKLTREKYLAAGLTDIVNSIVVVTSAHWDVFTLNRCIQTSDYAARMIEKSMHQKKYKKAA